jgi:hypothetical protein
MFNVPELVKVATTRLGSTSPAVGLRSDAVGGDPEGNTVR